MRQPPCSCPGRSWQRREPNAHYAEASLERAGGLEMTNGIGLRAD